MEAMKDQMAAMMEAMMSVKKIMEANAVTIAATSIVAKVNPPRHARSRAQLTETGWHRPPQSDRQKNRNRSTVPLACAVGLRVRPSIAAFNCSG